MVRKEPHAQAESRATPTSAPPLSAAIPEARGDRLRGRAGRRVYLVGGAVRDLLLGRGRGDLDLVVEGDPAEIARRLGGEVVEHERFATAKARLGRARDRHRPGPQRDLRAPRRPAARSARPASRRTLRGATSRSTRWRSRSTPTAPGGCSIRTEAGPTSRPGCCGCSTPAASATTRPGRCGRPATPPASGSSSRPSTAERLADDRPRHGLGRAARGRAAADRGGARPPRRPSSCSPAGGWSSFAPAGPELAARVLELLDEPALERYRAARARGARRRPRPAGRRGGPGGDRRRAPLGRGRGRPRARPRPSSLLARALGAEWLDEYLGRWSKVKLEIGGDDLLEAGVPAGPGRRPRPAGGAGGASSTARSRAARRSSRPPCAPPRAEPPAGGLLTYPR